MKDIRVLIVEDELIIAEALADMLRKVGYEVTDMVMSAEDALAAIESNMPDMILLDIRIKGEHNGIWLGGKIKRNYQIPFVYLTSHGDRRTVEEAIQTQPAGYILKPIEKEGLYATIETALYNHSLQFPNKSDDTNKPIFSIKDALFIKDEYLLVKMKFEDLLYIKAQGNYVELHTSKKKNLVKQTLKELISILPQDHYMQIHRSYVVNLHKVDTIGFSQISIGDQHIPLGKDKREALIARLQRL